MNLSIIYRLIYIKHYLVLISHTYICKNTKNIKRHNSIISNSIIITSHVSLLYEYNSDKIFTNEISKIQHIFFYTQRQS